ncbi:MAG: sigma-70 family RNA polymerase sigma factor [Acidobacteria bacterium]|nr:sigma-70 family RNA polymerase sigma factor [Acidobacteriota bacterium]MBI3428112.1 sigma-70 family RNA polymerase sigma factor [Acidobacteriota bacterium]
MLTETPRAEAAPGAVTQLLLQWHNGDQAAFDQLFPLVYEDLRRQARQALRGERAGQTLETRALVNEAYLRLVEAGRVDWHGRAHFLAIAAEVMRRVLVECARRRQRHKRGGEWTRVTLDESLVIEREGVTDLVALDEALEWLRQFKPRKARVVVLRFFGGLTIEETAAALGISTDTVKTDWQTARLWLAERLGGKEAHHESSAL